MAGPGPRRCQGSAAARAPVRGGAVRGHVRGSALWEWSPGGGRGGQRRAGAGPRRREDADLRRASRGCSAATTRRAASVAPRTSKPGTSGTVRDAEGRRGTPGAEPGRGEELRGAACSFAFLARVRKWVGVVWPASGGPRTPASREQEFTCVPRQRVGLEGSGSRLSLLAQWAVR